MQRLRARTEAVTIAASERRKTMKNPMRQTNPNSPQAQRHQSLATEWGTARRAICERRISKSEAYHESPDTRNGGGRNDTRINAQRPITRHAFDASENDRTDLRRALDRWRAKDVFGTTEQRSEKEMRKVGPGARNCHGAARSAHLSILFASWRACSAWKHQDLRKAVAYGIS